jgi:hypothetical protein
VAGHPQVDWPDGHFYETGNKLVLSRLMPDILQARLVWPRAWR